METDIRNSVTREETSIIKVVFICVYDWANACYTISKALNKVGVEAKTFAKRFVKYEYPERSGRFTKIKSIKENLEEANIIIFGYTDFFELPIDTTEKVIGVMHGGSKYRQNPKRFNKIFNKIVDISLVGSDMRDLNAKNEKVVFDPIDTDFLSPVYKDILEQKKIVGHYPSGNKGYDLIKPVIEKLQKEIDFEFRYSGENVGYSEQISRISKCDIYIENLRDNQIGKILTTFGRTALEAAALGKIVCTRFVDLPVYEKTIGPCSIEVTNTPEELEKKLRYLLSLPTKEIIELQEISRKWVVERHGLEPIGLLWKKILEKAYKQKRKENVK